MKTVLSVLSPSTTISSSLSVTGIDERVSPRVLSSFNVGIIIDILIGINSLYKIMKHFSASSITRMPCPSD
jgi:hypothetical protein